MHKFNKNQRKGEIQGHWKVTAEFPLSLLIMNGVDCRRRACLFLACEWYQRDVPASLHRHGYLSLMPSAVTRYPAWKDFATFGDEESECLYIFVIDKGRLVHTEPADFFSDLEASPFVAASTSGIPAVSPVFSSVIGTSIGWS